jgi:DNA-binding transcriptional MocR family regulator
MTLRRREQLVRLARQYDCLIITDDVYDMLQWPSSPSSPSLVLSKSHLPRIIDIDKTLDGGPTDKYGNAVSNQSFSKIIAPGVRTGWAEATPSLAYGISQTGSTRSGGAPSQLAASLVNEMLITGDLDQHIYHTLQPAYARRYHRLLLAVQQHLLPLGLTLPQPDKSVAGGYFLWLTLPAPLLAEDLWKRAQEDENVTIITGAKFRVEGDEDNPMTRFERDFRLCFAWVDEELLEEGVVRLTRVVKQLLEETGR